jgi:hypothetical protein
VPTAAISSSRILESGDALSFRVRLFSTVARVSSSAEERRRIADPSQSRENCSRIDRCALDAADEAAKSPLLVVEREGVGDGDDVYRELTA